jgi:hypothetical protein
MTYDLYCPHHLATQESQNSKATVRILDMDPEDKQASVLTSLEHMAMYEVQQFSSSKPVLPSSLIHSQVLTPLQSNIKYGEHQVVSQTNLLRYSATFSPPPPPLAPVSPCISIHYVQWCAGPSGRAV